MGSHSVTCHPTQVNTPRLNRSLRPVLNLPTQRDGRLSWPTGWNYMWHRTHWLGL